MENIQMYSGISLNFVFSQCWKKKAKFDKFIAELLDWRGMFGVNTDIIYINI